MYQRLTYNGMNKQGEKERRKISREEWVTEDGVNWRGRGMNKFLKNKKN